MECLRTRQPLRRPHRSSRRSSDYSSNAPLLLLLLKGGATAVTPSGARRISNTRGNVEPAGDRRLPALATHGATTRDGGCKSCKGLHFRRSDIPFTRARRGRATAAGESYERSPGGRVRS